MSTFTTRDGTEIYFKDWGSGKPVLFSHGWPLDADMWEYQMQYLSSRGYRTIAFDRRGFGRSSQPWTGYDYDTFADDIADLIEHLDLHDVTLVGFSMGGGDVKLLSASALWFGFDFSLALYMLAVAVTGGVLTVAILLLRSRSQEIMASGLPIPDSLLVARKVPYGIAIAIAGLLTYPEAPIVQAAMRSLY